MRTRRARPDLPWCCALAFALALVVVATGGCSTLLSIDATPVPGAAATLTRSLRTPIPTSGASPSPAASASPSPSRASAVASRSPQADGGDASDQEIAQIQNQLEQIISTEALAGLEDLLLDHVSVSTPQGGSVMDAGQTASWLRDRAGPSIKVTSADRGGQTLQIQVRSEGWPRKDPLQQGTVTFSLRRYDANGRPDDEAGTWKIDVVEVE
jgi:hypothetical protein